MGGIDAVCMIDGGFDEFLPGQRHGRWDRGKGNCLVLNFECWENGCWGISCYVFEIT